VLHRTACLSLQVDPQIVSDIVSRVVMLPNARAELGIAAGWRRSRAVGWELGFRTETHIVFVVLISAVVIRAFLNRAFLIRAFLIRAFLIRAFLIRAVLIRAPMCFGFCLGSALHFVRGMFARTEAECKWLSGRCLDFSPFGPLTCADA
jgi:hypothetical protein